MHPESERALVDRLRDGDPAAFEAVHAAFNRRLFTFLLRLCRRRDVAEDLLEDTWLRLVKHAGRLRPDTRMAPWLFTVARNLYLSHARAHLVDQSATATLMALWPTRASRPSPFEEAAASELERRVERALASMPPASREILLLVGIAGLTHAEAAEVCGITVEAARQRLSRARALLGRALDERGRWGQSLLLEVAP